MPAHPETTAAKLKSAIIATVGWLALAVPLYGALYACSVWLTPEPFATAASASARWRICNITRATMASIGIDVIDAGVEHLLKWFPLGPR
jgi:hypothetical protein